MNFVLPAGVEFKLCSALGDTGIVYTLYPFAAIPLYWLILGFAGENKD